MSVTLQRLVVRRLDGDVLGAALHRRVLLGALHERRDDVAVGGRRLGVQHLEPGVLVVLGGHGIAVGPLYTVAQREGVGEPVVADLHAFGDGRYGLFVPDRAGRGPMLVRTSNETVSSWYAESRFRDLGPKVEGEGGGATTCWPLSPSKTPQPAVPSRAAPARPVPLIFRKSLRLSLCADESLARPDSPYGHLILLSLSSARCTGVQT